MRVAVKQNLSNQLWGRGVFGGGLPAAVAYVGSLPAKEQGTEFTTEVPHAKNGDPAWAYWYLPEYGGDGRVRSIMMDGQQFASVEINPSLNRYRCKSKRND